MADDVLRITKADRPPGLILAGEIDESSYPVLAASLAAMDPGGEVHVDLSGIEYCDLAGLRAIVCVTGPGGGRLPGGQVVLHAVPARLRKILQILGWDVMPGVTFDERTLPGGRDQLSMRSGY